MEADPAAREGGAEYRLACAVARSAMDDAAVRRLHAAVSDLSAWEVVPPLLARHGLSIFAVRHLSTVQDAIPPAVWTTLVQQAREASARALERANELRRIIAAFAKREIPVLPFKGPMLAWRAYGDLGARPFVDLDLLVFPRDIGTGLEVLNALGYAPLHQFRDRQDAWFRKVDGDYQLVDADGTSLVELHAHVMSLRFGGVPSVEALWGRRDSAWLGGQSIPTLNPDDAFLAQALHGAKHRWERLEWVGAVAELLRQRDGNVASLLQTAPAARRAILLACTVASAWLDAPLSADTRAQCLADPVVARLAIDAWHHVVNGNEDDIGETAEKLLFNWRAQSGTAARVRFGCRWIFWPSPEDWEFVQLPDSIFFAYHLLRPLRLLVRYGRQLAGRQFSRA